MATWLEDIGTVLAGAGVATEGVDLFYSTQSAPGPLASGAYLVVIETGGTPPEHTQNSTGLPAYVFPGAQVTAVGYSYAEARALGRATYAALTRVRNEFVNSGWYRRIRPR